MDLSIFFDEEIMCLVENFCKGLLFVILVFDGVYESEIKGLLEFGGLLILG